MNRRKILLYLLLTGIALPGCEEQNDWDEKALSDNSIVVEGMITNETDYQTIRLTKVSEAPGVDPETVSGAEILVSAPDEIYKFEEEPGQPGTYRSKVRFAGKQLRTYTLLINHENNVITAKAAMPVAREFVFLRYVKHGSTGLFRLVWVASTYNANRPAMYEVLLDWSMVNGYENLPYHETHARLLYYTLPTLDVSQVFAPVSENVLFPPGTHITEKRFSITDSHAAFLRALLSETNWQGGLFNAASANLPTNLSGNARGYFSACAVTTRTDIARTIVPLTKGND